MTDPKPYTPKELDELEEAFAHTGELDELRELAKARDTYLLAGTGKFTNVRRVLEIIERLLATARDGVEVEQSFDLFDDAIMRGQKMWRDEKPAERELIGPDTGNLVAWLCALVDRAERTMAPGLPPDESPARDAICDLLTARLVHIGEWADAAQESPIRDLRDEKQMRALARLLTMRDSGGRDGPEGEATKEFWEQIGRALNGGSAPIHKRASDE